MNKRLPIACFGAANIDVTLRGHASMQNGTSNPVRTEIGFGGVARNVAVNLAHLSHHVALVSRVGSDLDGDALLDHLEATNIDIYSVARSATPTGRYAAALNPDGALFSGFASMAIYDEMNVAWVKDAASRVSEAVYWFMDTNLPEACLAELAAYPDRPFLVADAVSISKARRLTPIARSLDLLICNREEFETIGIPTEIVPTILITDGANGCLLIRGDHHMHFPAQPADVRSVTGAGDAFTSGIIHGLAQNVPWSELPVFGAAAAAMAVESPDATPSQLTADRLQARVLGVSRP